MSENTATPAGAEDGKAPVAPVATPVVVATETVTLSKEAHGQLERDAARAAANQRKADLFDKMNGKGGHFKTSAAPAATPTPEEARDAASAEDRKAERGLLALAADPSLRAVLDSDPTLRSLLMTNPLAVLPMYASDALDADDAITLVKEALLKKVPAAPTPKVEEKPVVVLPAGAVNPSDVPVNQEIEAARKLPNTEASIAGMIKARVKAGAK